MMSRSFLVLCCICALMLIGCVSFASAAESSQTLRVPHELNEHELTDHYGSGRDPRFDTSDHDGDDHHDEPTGQLRHPPSKATGYYPPPPPPAPPMPPSAKHKEAKEAAAAEKAAAAAAPTQ